MVATMRSGRSVRAKLLIGADGNRSNARKYVQVLISYLACPWLPHSSQFCVGSACVACPIPLTGIIDVIAVLGPINDNAGACTQKLVVLSTLV